jgi:hypothetical protein
MAGSRFKLILAGGFAGLAAACATMTDGGPATGFNAGASTANVPADAEAAFSGFQLNGPDFAGDLVFEDRGGRAVATYHHAVDGAATLVADMAVDGSWLVDGVRRFEGVSDRGVEITIEMISGPCEASGRLHARFATVSAGRLVYDGCALETGASVSWTESLPRYFSAIEACETQARQSSMAFARRGEGAVVHARSEGRVAVIRYRYEDSGRWECRVDAGRANWSVLPDRAGQQPGEGIPVFIPGRVPAAGEGCYLYERVEAEDGTVLGALGHDVCTPGFASAEPARFG